MTTTPRPRRARTLIVVLAVVAGACGDDSDPSDREQSLPGSEVQAGRLCIDASGGPVGTLGNPELDELSGAATSRIHVGLWAHNDKGDDARIFGVGLDGSDAGVWELTGVEATDGEDIAVGPGPDPRSELRWRPRSPPRRVGHRPPMPPRGRRSRSSASTVT